MWIDHLLKTTMLALASTEKQQDDFTTLQHTQIRLSGTTYNHLHLIVLIQQIHKKTCE